MFDIGFAELLIIGVVALVVLGPERLPVAARTAGLWIGRIRRTVGSIQSEISEELRAEELKRNISIHKDELDRELAEMRQPFVPTSAPATSTVKPEEEPKPQPVKQGESSKESANVQGSSEAVVETQDAATPADTKEKTKDAL